MWVIKQLAPDWEWYICEDGVPRLQILAGQGELAVKVCHLLNQD